ncbi:UvrD-helicase domain-containing protein, partial [Bradyrhizobium sp.]
MVKAIRPIPGAVRDKQASASNPTSSSFVSANAGSGKTHVLVQRVI